MKYGDRLAKILADRPSSELTELQRDLNKLWDDQQVISGWLQTGQSRIAASAIDFPVALLYSETFAADTGTITINLPSTYNHLIVFGSGRSTVAGSAFDSLAARFNGDAGTSYFGETIFTLNGTVTGNTTGTTNVSFGPLVGSGMPAGYNGGFLAYIPSYNEPYFKHLMLLYRTNSAGTESAGLSGATYRGTAAIETLAIFAGAGSIAAGSNLSIFGVK